MKSLLFAIGNNGRQDDGLGWAFGEALEGRFEGEIHFRYQLQVEDAELASRADHIVFVDANKGGNLPGGVQWESVAPAANFEFTTHALSPGAILHLCSHLFDKTPKAHCLLIQGEAWELGLPMTATAQANLERALDFFQMTGFRTR